MSRFDDTYPFLWSRIMENVIDTPHLSQDAAKGQSISADNKPVANLEGEKDKDREKERTLEPT